MKYAPIQNVVMDALIEKGYLTPPEDGICGAVFLYLMLLK